MNINGLEAGSTTGAGRVNLNTCRELAATAWCQPETDCIEMDTRLAEAFAQILHKQTTKLEQYRSLALRLSTDTDPAWAIERLRQLALQEQE